MGSQRRTTWALRAGFALCLVSTAIILFLTGTKSLHHAAWVFVLGVSPLIVVFFVVERMLEKVLGRERENAVLFHTFMQNSLKDAKAAEEKLKKANLELERFAYLASHDLKEPIRMIGTYLGVFHQKYGANVDDQGRQYLAYAMEGSRRLATLVDSLLRYSRLGTDRLEPVPLELASVINDAMVGLKDAIIESKAEIVCESLPRIEGDKVQFSMLFQNLLSNAIKFRKPGTVPQIKVEGSEDGATASICVSDNGIGIDPKDQKFVFEIFRRAHARSQYPGDGIGLASCKRIVESHGGSIWVESTPGTGSKFCIKMPVAFPKPQSHQTISVD
jgi:light-regulated signal transduction histidine kinase (bacteriophytochrome)